MIFFGIISNKKDFNIIKLEIEKSIKDASIIEKGLGAGITDTWENDGKFFHVGTSLEIVN